MKKRLEGIHVLMILTAVLITVTGVIFKQAFLRILPLYISIIIMFLNSNINRFASLAGGINSILYGCTYLYYKLYGTAAYTFLVSFPFQIVTFILWSKRKDGNTTRLRKMTPKQRIFATIISGILWVIIFRLLRKYGGNHSILDNTSTILGIVLTFMTMFAYIEYTIIGIINCIIVVLINLSISIEKPEMITYLVYSVYSLICVVKSYFKAKQIYNKQTK